MASRTIALVGHDNYGSREIFTRIYKENRSSDIQFILFISTGLYYKKSFVQSVIKLLKEASFLFCLIRFLEGLLYKFRGDTLLKRAKDLGVTIYFTEDINSSTSHEIFKCHEVELVVSMFTMQIFNQKTIDLPKLGTIGTHPSVLPQYRGLEVFFWMLVNREPQAGVSVFFLSPKIDAGRVFLQELFKIETDESVDSIYKKLTKISAGLLSSAVKKVLNKEELQFVSASGVGSYYPMPTRAAFRKFLKTEHTWFGVPKSEDTK